MKLRLFLIIILWNTFAGCLYAQKFSGIVVDAYNNQPLPFVNIINNTKNNSSISEQNGTFSIEAKANDFIAFTAIGYDTVIMMLTAGVTTGWYKRVRMNKKVYSIGEVEISALTPYQQDSVERRATYASQLNEQKVRSVMSPITALADNISRKKRMLWRFQRNFAKWEDEKYIDTRYTAAIVTSVTGLSEQEAYRFMAAYPIDADYARVATDIEIQMWISYNFKQWSKKPGNKGAATSTDSLSFDK